MRLRSAAVFLGIALFACGEREGALVVDLPSYPTAAIDSLRAEGRYESALLLARERDAKLRHDSRAPRWMLGDSRRLVRTISRIAAFPDSLQQTMARADRGAIRADSLDHAGELDLAIRERELELRARRRVLGDHHADVATTLLALARLQVRASHASLARELNEEALAIRTRALGRRHPLVAECLQALAWDAKGGGQREAAMRLFRQARHLQRALLGPRSSSEMATLEGMANLYRVERRPDSAAVLFREVLEYRRQETPRDDAAIGDVLFDLGMTLTPDGHWVDALPMLEEAVARHRAAGARASLALGRSLGAYGTALRHLGRSSEAEPVLRESATIFERLRANAPPGPLRGGSFSLVSYALLAAAQLESGHEADAWRSLERPLGRGLVEAYLYRAAIDTTGWAKDGLARVQRAMARDEALIGWLTVRPGAAQEEYPFWCYCIRPEGAVHWVRVDRPEESMQPSDISLDESRRELTRAANWPLRMIDAGTIRELGRAAYDRRFAPLEPFLRGVTHLTVVSPDLTHGSPLAAWVDADGRWLADRFAIAYVPSSLLYANLAASDALRSRPDEWRTLLVAGPRAGSEGEEKGAEERLASEAPELQAVSDHLHAPPVLLDSTSTAGQLRDLASNRALSGFQLIHFAAHSAVRDDAYGSSALLFAPADSDIETRAAPTPANPDRLTMDEISRSWRLDADLVTLAACQSALGRFLSSDGFFGLSYVLLSVGARTVLASLWPVDDRATGLLLGRFYRNILLDDFHPGDSLLEREAAALREASLWLRTWRDAEGGLPYEHPIYWAGFILIGGGAGDRNASSSRGADQRKITTELVDSSRSARSRTR